MSHKHPLADDDGNEDEQPRSDVNTDEQPADTDAGDGGHPWGEWPDAVVDKAVVPESMREMEIWMLWSPEFGKTPMAPWKTGHMYRAKWGAQVDNRPETDYDQANMVAQMGPKSIHRSYSFPPIDDGNEPHIPQKVFPTVLLPHEPADPPLMLVDFDDVRNPDTGTISPEVRNILDQLDAYVEVSQSGEGLHAFVRAELPGALGKLLAPLDTVGDIEFYDHGRFVGCTWSHIMDTPETVPERQDVIDELVREYEDESQKRRRKRNPRTGRGGSVEAKRANEELDGIAGDFKDYSGLSSDDAGGSADDGDADDAQGGSGGASPGGNGGGSGSSRRNAYYHDLDLSDAVFEGDYGTAYSRHSTAGSGRSWANGPHPGHGPQHSDVDECTNFGIRDDGWSCFAHDGGAGGALALLAVTKGVVDCGEAGEVHDRPAALLKTCLYAREIEPALEDADPPYTALVGVAEQFDLPFADPDKKTLGESRSIARQIYDEMDASGVEGA